MTLILPNHEQNFPTVLLPTRLEEYVRDGQPPTQDRQAAMHCKPQDIVDTLTGLKTAANKFTIDTRYFVGTGYHETNYCINEWDTEIATANSPQGFKSVGLYQIGEEEAKRFNYSLQDMLDYHKASACMFQLATSNLQVIFDIVTHSVAAAKANNKDYIDTNGKLWVDGGLRAYMAIMHNHGYGYVKTTIQNYGLDWARYKQRNPHDNIVAHGYGEDCVTGGTTWPAGAV